MSYKVIISQPADRELKNLKKNEPQAFKKAMGLIVELREHPTTGTGHPKPLGGNMTGKWSRRITEKHRLIYKILEEQAIVSIFSAYGHYYDK
jgi:toxin YoeB